MRTALLLPSVLAASLVAGACDRPLVVRADPAGTEKLSVQGEGGRTGKLTRALKVGDVVVPAGTAVAVEETWLLRKDGAKRPPGFRVTGLYDPATRHDGLMLERGAVEVYWYAAVLPERRARLAVPQEALALDPR